MYLALYVGNRGTVTAGDVEFARTLAAAAEAFRLECERMHVVEASAPRTEALPISA